MSTEEIVIIVPCFNEAARLDPDAFLYFLNSVSHARICFVDDGSNDFTRCILDDVASRGGRRIHVISHATNRGKANAVRSGMMFGYKTDATIIGFLDADLATPLSQVLQITKAFANPAIRVAIGVRGSAPGVQRAPHRRLIQHLFAAVSSLWLNHKFEDTQCGAKFFRRDDNLQKVFATPFLSRWLFDLEVLHRYQTMIDVEQPFVDWLAQVPLERWCERPGSHVVGMSYLQAFGELIRLMRHHGIR